MADQLAEIEALLQDFRWARDKSDVPEHRTFHVLKIVASDLRGRLPGAAGEALAALDRRFGDLEQTRARIGAEVGVLQELVGRWPVIRHALVLAANGANDSEETRG